MKKILFGVLLLSSVISFAKEPSFYRCWCRIDVWDTYGTIRVDGASVTEKRIYRDLVTSSIQGKNSPEKLMSICNKTIMREMIDKKVCPELEN